MEKATEQWTTRRLLEWMSERFESHEIESPRLLAEMLLTEVFGGQRIDLYTQVDRIATEIELGKLREFVQRAINHEPVQYIVRNAWFFGLEFKVDQSTLIPRSCTEVLVSEIARHCKERALKTPFIADIGTGSGCIAVSLAKQLQEARITATDISEEALSLAEHNAETHRVTDQLSWVQGDCLTPLSGQFDVVCSNPPYIPNCELDTLAPNVRKWEPQSALSGGDDGLLVIKPILTSVQNYLKDGGYLIIEIASSITNDVLDLAKSNDQLTEASILKDQHGDDRFLRAYKSMPK